MIEVNLLPGGKNRGAGRSFSLGMPSLGGGGPDRWVVGAVLAWIVALAWIGTSYFSATNDLEELEVAIEQEVQDSIRFAAQSERIAELRARRDSINDRIAVIQEIDQGRFTWAHVMDEIARALPDFTWLTAVTAASPEPEPEILIDGRAGTQIAVSEFLNNLELSPFFRSVDPVQITAVAEGGENVQDFSITLTYVQPPFEELQSVPLFQDGLAPPVVDTGAAPGVGGEE